MTRSQSVVVMLIWTLIWYLSACGAQTQELVTVNRRHMLKAPLPLIHLDKGEGVIFPAKFGEHFLRQCSRPTLGKGDSYWTPHVADVEKIEQTLDDYIKQGKLPSNLEKWPDLSDYHRQYVGVIRGSRTSIYANFFPANGFGDEDWRREPVDVCDGGSAYFGVEIDAQDWKILDFQSNGCLCTVTPISERNPTDVSPTSNLGSDSKQQR